jgi:hypothetical protein
MQYEQRMVRVVSVGVGIDPPVRREKNESARTPVRVLALVEQPSPESVLFQLRLCRKLREWPESAGGGTDGPSARTRDALNLRSRSAYYGNAFKNISPLNVAGGVKPRRICTLITIEPIPHVDGFEAGGQTYRRSARPEA